MSNKWRKACRSLYEMVTSNQVLMKEISASHKREWNEIIGLIAAATEEDDTVSENSKVYHVLDRPTFNKLVEWAEANEVDYEIWNMEEMIMCGDLFDDSKSLEVWFEKLPEWYKPDNS